MREGDVRISSGCAIACVFHKDKQMENGERIIASMRMMHDRSNGLGGGFVGYGIYPEYKDQYAVHIFYDHNNAKKQTEAILFEQYEVVWEERIPTKELDAIKDTPLIWRYFINSKVHTAKRREEEQIVATMFEVNTKIAGAYIFSCGKNMGIFKGVGYPEDIGEFYQLQNYQAYTWIAHGRYPTNTPGWWAGAHPFGLLDFALVHNGEISSYDANRRYIEMFGYPCSLLTDTEVITYMLDFLIRRKGFLFEECADVLASPFWEEIDQMEEEKRRYYTMLRRNMGSLLITGPFSIILGFEQGIAALNDRLKLRALMVAQHDNCVYMASEESAIRAMDQELSDIMSLDGGVPFVMRYEEVEE